MAERKGSIGAGILYFVLAVAFVFIGVVGVNYQINEEHHGKLFYKKGNTVINRDDAALGMMPVGFGGGIGLAVFGFIRMRGPRDEEKDESKGED